LTAPQCNLAIEWLAALSHQADFFIGCYCEAEAHGHRSLLAEKGAALAAK
jgi:hypothetical protein